MKKIKSVDFGSTLLVPFPKFAGGMSFRWVTTIHGKHDMGTENVNVIVFNTEKKEEMKPLLEKDLAELKKIENPDANVKNQIGFIEKTLGEIGVSGFEHAPSKELLEAVAQGSGKSFSANEVIYLSGVTNLVEA